MDPTKSISRGISCDMSPAAIQRRLETVDELRELANELSQAERLGPIENKQSDASTTHVWADERG